MSYYETIKAIHDYTEAKEAVDTAFNNWQFSISAASYPRNKFGNGRIDYIFPTTEDINGDPAVIYRKKEYDEALAKFNRLVGIATVIALSKS